MSIGQVIYVSPGPKSVQTDLNYSFYFVHILFPLPNLQLVGQALIATLKDTLGEDLHGILCLHYKNNAIVMQEARTIRIIIY